MSYPETHVVEIDRPKGMPLQIRGMFVRGVMKWMSFCAVDAEGQQYICDAPEEQEDKMIESMKVFLQTVYDKSERDLRKLWQDGGYLP
tara:strand:- start:223 stop:486 length:264 start_codon:yes stop_codon:yes gene_type:complete